MATFTYYFDGSDTPASDGGSDWSNVTNADDGSTSTAASTTAGDSSFLSIGGTNAPSSGGAITQVRVRAYGAYEGNVNDYIDIHTDGLGEFLAGFYINVAFTPDWSSYTTLSTPTGGWTWAKVQALEARVYTSSIGPGPYSMDVRRIEIEVTTDEKIIDYNPNNADKLSWSIGVDDSGSGAPDRVGAGQSFTGNGDVLRSITVLMDKEGTPLGNLTASVYAHSGTFGTSSLPTGSALATSDTHSVSEIQGVAFNKNEITFNFNTPFQTVDGTKYTFLVNSDTLTTSINDRSGVLSTDELTHPGNVVYDRNSAYGYNASYDIFFTAENVYRYYFNGSDQAATATSGTWTNITNADDGSTVTLASSSGSAVGIIGGTNAPSSGDTITQVRARAFGGYGGISTIEVEYFTDTKAQSLGSHFIDINSGAGSPGWSDYVTLSTPTGGWTWAKLQALEAEFTSVVSVGDVEIGKIEIEVTVSSSLTLSTDQMLFEFTAASTPLVTADTSNSFIIDTTTITQNHILTPDDIAFSAQVDDGSIGQDHLLSPEDISFAITLDTLAITQNHILVVQELDFVLTEDNALLTQNHPLPTQDLLHSFTLDATTITQNHQIATDDITFSTQVDNGGLGQDYIINSQDISHVFIAENASLNTQTRLYADDVGSVFTIGTTSITQNHVLPTDDIALATAVDDSGLGQNYVIDTQDISQSLTLTDVGLIINYPLDVDDINFITQVDDADLTQNHVLTPEDIAFQQAISDTSIVRNHVITPSDLFHVFTIDNTDLIENYNLAIDDIEHTITLTNTVVENTNHYLATPDIYFGPPRHDFYFDRDGDIYWVVDHNIGIVEKV